MTPGLFPPLVHELVGRCRFPAPGTPVACAVSGGADSLALLVLAVAADCEVTAIHVEHGLRPDGAGEAAVVADAAARFGARFESIRVDVETGPNLEARARAARYAVLPPDVFTGHTADDQAETVLLNIIRGAGLDGLAGMRAEPVGGQRGPRRPLLGVRRAETRSVCEAVGLAPVDDPSNRDPAFRRNRVRHEVVPLLTGVAERDVVPIVARLAGLAADEVDLLDELARHIDPSDALALGAAPAALARRAIRSWLRHGSERYAPDAATVERVLAVARAEALATDVGHGRRVVRSKQRLRVEESAPAPTP